MGDSCNAPQPAKGHPEVQGSKGRREKTAKTSVFRPGASEPRRADLGRPERASEAKERCSQTERQRERETERQRQRGCPLESKTEKKRQRGVGRECLPEEESVGHCQLP